MESFSHMLSRAKIKGSFHFSPSILQCVILALPAVKIQHLKKYCFFLCLNLLRVGPSCGAILDRSLVLKISGRPPWRECICQVKVDTKKRS